MNFTIKSIELLETYKLIWNKIKNIIGNNFSRQLINMERYPKSKLKVYNGEVHKKILTQ